MSLSLLTSGQGQLYRSMSVADLVLGTMLAFVGLHAIASLFLPFGWDQAILASVGQAMADICAVKLGAENDPERAGCDFVVGLGDNIYESGVTSVDDPQFEEKFELPFEPVDLPFYLVLGNHDWKGSGEAWLEVARRYPQVHFPHFYYFEQWPDA